MHIIGYYSTYDNEVAENRLYEAVAILGKGCKNTKRLKAGINYKVRWESDVFTGTEDHGMLPFPYVDSIEPRTRRKMDEVTLKFDNNIYRDIMFGVLVQNKVDYGLTDYIADTLIKENNNLIRIKYKPNNDYSLELCDVCPCDNPDEFDGLVKELEAAFCDYIVNEDYSLYTDVLAKKGFPQYIADAAEPEE